VEERGGIAAAVLLGVVAESMFWKTAEWAMVNAVRILKQVLDDASWREEKYATVLEVT
jgi:hypothetical protein